MQTLKSIFVGVVALSSAGASSSRSTRCDSFPKVLRSAEEASRAAEAEAKALRMLRDRGSEDTQAYDEKVSSAMTAIDMAKNELELTKPTDRSLLFRTGVGVAALAGTVASRLYGPVAESKGNNDESTIEAVLTEWITNFAPTVAISFVASVSLAMLVLWRDREGRDFISTAYSTALSSTSMTKQLKPSNTEDREINEIRELHEQTEIQLAAFESTNTELLDPQLTPLLRSYTARINEAVEDILRYTDQVQCQRLVRTSTKIQNESEEIEKKAKRLGERNAEFNRWDFIIAMTSILCSGSSTLAGVCSWLVSVPFAASVLRLFEHDSYSAVVRLERRVENLNDALSNGQQERLA
ncbi:hypothetical protein NDN08_003029 [Rhodosorus marinus]|uniref:Uncharacterized protein n=1 Tax=Rhodosorus marinus TaxID=101924 RepID=A0AAV8V160_9RHOD|nr:hypothetical protein NDN08_003029 [Rhodosorus marinus]